MTSITDKYSVNEADIFSSQNISIQLFRNNLSFNYDFDTKYNWLYKNNPFGRGQQLFDLTVCRFYFIQF